VIRRPRTLPEIIEFITTCGIRWCPCKGAQSVLRDHNLPTHTTDVSAWTSLPVDECRALVPIKEAFFGTWPPGPSMGGVGWHDALRRISTVPCRCRKSSCCACCAILCRPPHHSCMGACLACAKKATPWIDVLLPGWRHTLRTLGDALCRQAQALRAQPGVARSPRPVVASPPRRRIMSPHPGPRVVMTGPSGPTRAPRTRLPRRRMIAASTSGTR
jgi:hypothetical protein